NGARSLLCDIENFLSRAEILLNPLALSDVAPHSPVALEASFFIEDRRAADAGVPGDSVRGNAAVFASAEGLASPGHRLVLGPRRRHWRRILAKLPAGLAKVCFGPGRVPGEHLHRVRHVREAQVLVLLPVPV